MLKHIERYMRRGQWARIFALLAALVVLLAGCVMPDGTVYTLPQAAFPVAADTEQSPTPDTDAEPGPADAHIALAREYGAAGDPEAALVELNQAIAADPNAAEAYYYRARAYADMGDFAAAMPDLDRALALTPDDVDSLILRAQLFWELGDVAASAADYDRALTLSNGGEGLDSATREGAYYVRAVDHYIKGDLSAVAANVAEILRINPWSTDWYPEYSRYAQSATHYEVKVAAYDALAAAAASPGSAAYAEGMKHLLRAQLLEIPEEYSAAVVALTTAIEADPEMAAAYHARGVARILSAAYAQGGSARYSSGDGEVTYTDPTTGEEVTTSQEAYDAMLAEADEAVQTARTQGVEDLNRALALDPARVEAIYDLGVAYFAQQEQYMIGFVYTVPDENGRDQALQRFDQAVAAAPEWDQARLGRMLASLHWGIQDSIADETSPSAKQLFETALQDAEFLIAGDAGEGWPYYVRFSIALQLVGFDSDEMDEDTQAQFEADFATFRQLSPNVNLDDAWVEAAAAVRFSSPVPPTSPLMVSHIEGEIAGEQTLVHPEAGFALDIPIEEVRQHIMEVSVPNGPIQITMSSDFRTYGLLVYEAEVGDLSMEEWLTSELSQIGIEEIEFLDPYITDYGEATIFAVPGFQMAALPIDQRVFIFSHARSEMWSATLGGDAVSRPEVLRFFIAGLTLLEE